MKTLAVLPGSYDPVTRGHLEIIRRAASVFGRCEVVVMNNRAKKTRFSMEDRLAFCRAAVKDLENVTVTSYEGLLYKFLADRPDAVLVKGIRNGEDLLYERRQTAYNYPRCGVETVYLDAGEKWQGVSSSMVRTLLDENGNWKRLVPKEIVPLLREKIK